VAADELLRADAAVSSLSWRSPRHAHISFFSHPTRLKRPRAPHSRDSKHSPKGVHRQTPEGFEGGDALFDAVCAHEVEGVVAKRRKSRYRAGEGIG
jgi:hypothetical protein